MRRLVLALVLLAAAHPAQADGWSFSVPQVLMETWIEPDGTVSLEETFAFENRPGAHPIDAIDVGMPSKDWSLADCSAWQGEERIDVLTKSPYVDNGVAVDLSAHPIAPGGKGAVTFRARRVGSLLFTDTSLPGMASYRVTPTWFDARFVGGESRVRVVIHFPPGVPAGAVKWQRVPYTGQVEVDATPERPAHAAVAFDKTYSFTGPWEVGVSFPTTDAGGKELVTGVQHITTMDLLAAWAGSPGVHGPLTVTFLIGFAIAFFWATRRTGCVVWAICSAVLGVLMLAKPLAVMLLWPALVGVVITVAFARKRRRLRWVPAVASVEGGGIKRGLTAPEAACLLQAPPDRILLLVLYGISKKGMVTLSSPEDGKTMKARTTTGYGLTPAEDTRLAAEKSSVLQPYESAFLALLARPAEVDVASVDWSPALDGLVHHAATRLSGYDLEQTKAYYQAIVERAWKEASTVGDVTLRQEAVDRNLDWMIIQRDAFGRMDAWQRSGWSYWSPWLPGGHGTVASSSSAGLPSAGLPPAPPGAGSVKIPGTAKASDVAGSLGGRLEGLSGAFATSLGLGGQGGVFKGVDHVTGEAFKQMIEQAAKGGGSSGGSGGGFSCACACAGCACACACAGGGR